MDAREIRALARHAGDVVEEVTTTVEDTSQVVRNRVRRGLGPFGGSMDLIDAHQAGVYTTVRATARVSSRAAGCALQRSTPAGAQSVRTNPAWAPFVAGLGAAFGDRLDPALTNEMALWRDGRPISAHDLPASPALIVFVHGLGATELMWDPAYLEVGPHAMVRYNTGRPIAENGRALAGLLAQTVDSAQVKRLILVGHSMGGLVARSAIAQAPDAQWVRALSDLITLGSPHTGAPLERVAARLLAFGQRSRSAAPIVRLGQRRSQGIKDLRFAAMSDGDWSGEVDAELIDNTAVIDLPAHVSHHAVVAFLAPVVGDGIVPASSAAHPGAQVTVVPGDHLSLLKDPQVRDLLAQVARG